MIFNVSVSIKILKWGIIGLTLSFFIIALSACMPSYETLPIELEDYPVEANGNITTGDTREKVLSIYGEPLIDASKMGVQVFQHIALPGSKFYPEFSLVRGDVYIYTLVTYDEIGLVKGEVHVIYDENTLHLHQEVGAYIDGFSFLGLERSMPQTLLGPSISSKELAETSTSKNGCNLIVIISECPMAKISLDNEKIIDLGSIGVYCRPGLDQHERQAHNYYGTYIKKEIHIGAHNIEMSKGRWDKKFESNFECEQGETIISEFKAHGFVKSLLHGIEPDGEISIFRPSPESSIIEGDTLWPILWHGGIWYGPPGILREK